MDTGLPLTQSRTRSLQYVALYTSTRDTLQTRSERAVSGVSQQKALAAQLRCQQQHTQAYAAT